jgi:plastocyanin
MHPVSPGWKRVAASLAAVASAHALAAEVRGTVSYAGPERRLAPAEVTKDGATCGSSAPDESLAASNGRLANVVVTLDGAPPGAARRVTLDQRGCRFVPHVQVAPLGSTLEVVNADPILHSVHGWVGHATMFNAVTPGPGAPVPVRLDRPGLIQVRCDVHAWMRAYVVVADGPAAVTGAEGTFSLGDVPPGTYTVTAWHERLGQKTAQLSVPAQGASVVDFAFGG